MTNVTTTTTADPYGRDEDSNIHLHLHLVAYRHRRPAVTGERMMLSTAARSAERRTRDKVDRMINYIDYSIIIDRGLLCSMVLLWCTSVVFRFCHGVTL